MPVLIKLANLSLFIVLFGQLGFSAIAYYLQLEHPSWFFWAILYIAIGVITLWHAAEIKLLAADILFGFCVIYVILNFLILGESNPFRFSIYVLLYWMIPYVSGRVLGRYFKIYHLNILYVLAISYVLLVVIEFIKNPNYFGTDRLLLFNSKTWDGAGGDSTHFFLGTAIGAAWVTALSVFVVEWQYKIKFSNLLRRWMKVILLVFPVVLVTISSRGSLLATILCAATILFLARRVSIRIKWGITIAILFGALLVYSQLSEERKILINEIPMAVVNTEYYESGSKFCDMTQKGSIIAHAVLIREAFSLFASSPVYGIGATNYGLRYCGEKTQFGSPHGLIVHALVEYGLIGSTIWFLAVIGIFVIFFLKVRSTNIPLNAELWALFSLWLFFFFVGQFKGNLYYDYHIFIVSGLLVSKSKFGMARTINIQPQSAKLDKAKISL